MTKDHISFSTEQRIRERPINVLVVHDFYKERGGEDGSFRANCDALATLGFIVHTQTFNNHDMDSKSAIGKLDVTLWNRHANRIIRDICLDSKIDIMHAHNTFPLASPSIYYAAKSAGAKVVQWLHNYRLLCPGASFFRNGSVCELCMKQLAPWPSIVHACYRNDRAASAAVSAMLVMHRIRGTWANKVDKYIALTEFGRDKFVEAGFSPDQIAVIPNHVDPDPGPGAGAGGYGFFAGRLTEEKGVRLLLDALARRKTSDEFVIVGDGQLLPEVQSFCAQNPRTRFLGPLPNTRVLELMKEARFVVFPSLWYEGLPRTIIESFAVGTPVVGPYLGAMSGLITAGGDGLHFKAGDPISLAAAIDEIADDQARYQSLRENARRKYLDNFTRRAVLPLLKSLMNGLLAESGVRGS